MQCPDGFNLLMCVMQPIQELFWRELKRDTRRRRKEQTGTQSPPLIPPPPAANALSSCFCGSHRREAAWKKEWSRLGGKQWEDFFHVCLSDGDTLETHSEQAIHFEVCRQLRAMASCDFFKWKTWETKNGLIINCFLFVTKHTQSVTLRDSSDPLLIRFAQRLQLHIHSSWVLFDIKSVHTCLKLTWLH